VVVDLPVQPFFNGPLPTQAALFLKGELPWPPTRLQNQAG
jgi:tungstate transport system ATP-binding protein